MTAKLAAMTRAIEASVRSFADSPLPVDTMGDALPLVLEPRVDGQLVRVTIERATSRQAWRGRRAGTS